MPTYCYECPDHGEFEEYHSITIKLELCPLCQKEGKIGDDVKSIKRLIAGSTLGVVELTGHELDAKLKSDVVQLKKDMYSKESVYSNLLGEGNYQGLQTKMDKQKKDGVFRRK